MDKETVVAVFDSSADADAAVRELEQSGIPSSDITRRHGTAGSATAGTSISGTTTTTPELSTTDVGHDDATAPRERGFWATLFGSDERDNYDRGGAVGPGEERRPYDAAHHDRDVYERSMAGGGSIVAVSIAAEHAQRVAEILERHNPVDIDERAASYGIGGGQPAMHDEPPATASGLRTGASGAVASGVGAGEEQVIPLSEERLSVGKRMVNRGTTRIRRFVVETPVEENVRLRTETVAVDRRPVTGEGHSSDADFTDRVIEVTETAEEPVVAKTAQVREEVVIRKQAAERTETVHDTVRREDVEIDRPGAAAAAAPAQAGRADPAAPRR